MRISDWSSDVCSSDLMRSGRSRPAGPSLGGGEVAFLVVRVGRDLVLVVAVEECRQRGALVVPSLAIGGEFGVEQAERLGQIGRASCREGVGQAVKITVGAVHIQKKKQRKYQKN